jgi:hypothetical protein
VRWLVVPGSLFVAACAATNAPAPTPVPPPPAAVDIEPLTPPPPVDTTALKAKADEAVSTAVKKLHDIRVTCGTEWLETSVACPESEFASIAADYQAFYGERGDVRRETAGYYSLPRLGGPTRTVEQVTQDLVMGCEDGCRSERNTSINAALDEASEACKKAKSGFAACKALEKRLSKNVRESEVERWVGLCEGRCEDHRDQVRYAAEIDRKRPKTQAEAAKCQAACRKQHEGSWCGTGLISCLSDCTPK